MAGSGETVLVQNAGDPVARRMQLAMANNLNTIRMLASLGQASNTSHTIGALEPTPGDGDLDSGFERSECTCSHVCMCMCMLDDPRLPPVKNGLEAAILCIINCLLFCDCT